MVNVWSVLIEAVISLLLATEFAYHRLFSRFDVNISISHLLEKGQGVVRVPLACAASSRHLLGLSAELSCQALHLQLQLVLVQLQLLGDLSPRHILVVLVLEAIAVGVPQGRSCTVQLNQMNDLRLGPLYATRIVHPQTSLAAWYVAELVEWMTTASPGSRLGRGDRQEGKGGNVSDIDFVPSRQWLLPTITWPATLSRLSALNLRKIKHTVLCWFRMFSTLLETWKHYVDNIGYSLTVHET